MNTFVFISPRAEIKIIVTAGSFESALVSLDSRLEDLKLLRVFIDYTSADFSLQMTGV